MDKAALISLLLTSVTALAESSVLVSGFDPFDGAESNNSEIIAKQLVEDLSKARPSGEFRFCSLRTVYDKSADALIDCVRSMKTPPQFVLSLGEAGCGEMRLETSARNYDEDFSADNDGIHREGIRILPNGPDRSPFNLPLHKAWCELPNREKKFVKASRDAGSFVCNNMSYLISQKYPEIRFAFMHVPNSGCFWRAGRDTRKSVRILRKLVLNMLAPRSEWRNFSHHPTTREETLSRISGGDSCDRNFYADLLERF